MHNQALHQTARGAVALAVDMTGAAGELKRFLLVTSGGVSGSVQDSN
jgi:hypothetical protein